MAMKRRSSCLGVGLACYMSVLPLACGGGSSSSAIATGSIGVKPSMVQVVAYPGVSGTSLPITITRPVGDANSVTLQVSGLPAGVQVQAQSPGTGPSGSIVFSVPVGGSVAAGDYPVQITATDANDQGSATVTFTVGVAVGVPAQPTTPYSTFLSTSFFQINGTSFFADHSQAVSLINGLEPQHVRLQVLEIGSPESSAGVWNFSSLDATMQPLLTVADQSPEFQIGQGPSYMYDSQGNLLDSTYQQFAQYAKQLVQYYNGGGFTSNGTLYESPSSMRIPWWGIYNEPNLHYMTPAQYAALYNTTVAAMQAVDPNINFVAAEMAAGSNMVATYLPAFLTNVHAPMAALALHLYSACTLPSNLTDQKAFDSIAVSSDSFVTEVSGAVSQLKQTANYANTPVWVTENNVNSDFFQQNGLDICMQQPFVADTRGTSVFFAAWHPYVFSQLAKAGLGALYQFDFDDSTVFSEVDTQTAAYYISYWVDQYIGKEMAVPQGSTYSILPTTSSDSTVEVMGSQHPDGTIALMIADHGVAHSTDVNGTGVPRSVQIDLSHWPAFSSATLIALNATTNVTQGPQPVVMTPGTTMQLTLPGYGVDFLILKP